MNRIKFFMHPIPALAMIGMAINDHDLKFAYPNWFTGKLSDFLGVFFFPLFLAAIVVLVTRLKFTSRVLATTMAITCVLMFLTKLDPSVAKWIETSFSAHLFKIKLTPDITDLIALPVSLPLCYLFARKDLQSL